MAAIPYDQWLLNMRLTDEEADFLQRIDGYPGWSIEFEGNRLRLFQVDKSSPRSSYYAAMSISNGEFCRVSGYYGPNVPLPVLYEMLNRYEIIQVMTS